MTKIEFEDLYKQYFQEIYRFCAFRLDRKEDAEDIVSEVFIKLYKQPFGSIQNPRAWLYKVARNTIYDKFAKGGKVSSNSELDPNDSFDLNQVEDSTFDTNQDLEKIVIEDELSKIILEEVKKLDDESQEIIVLKIWEELTFGEISKIIELPENTVKQRFYRNLEKIKNQISSIKYQRVTKAIVPMILAGLLAMKNDSSFALQTASAQAITESINSNLNINLQTMELTKPVET